MPTAKQEQIATAALARVGTDGTISAFIEFIA
jgi:hypothetical protein